MQTEEFIIFDSETTGLYPHLGDVMIELAGLRINKDGKVLDEFQRFINSGIPSHPDTVRIHGLTDQFIVKHGVSPQEAYPAFMKFAGTTTLVGHNIREFDMKFLNRALVQIGLPVAENPLIDTLDLARAKLPQLPNHKLGTLASKFGIDYTKAHRAIEDVKINAEVFVRLLML